MKIQTTPPRLHVTLLVCSIVVAGCGAGEAPQADPAPPPLQSGELPEQHASTAASLPPPNSVAPPIVRNAPSAPAEWPLRVASNVPVPTLAPLVLPVLRQVVESGLKHPTDLAFTSEGVMLYTIADKGLFAKQSGQMAVAVFAPKDLATTGGAGVLGVAVDPDFAKTRSIYVTYTSSAGGRDNFRIARLRVDTSYRLREEPTHILAGVETASSVQGDSKPRSSWGGRLRFGHDGFLYVGLGDGGSAQVAQSPRQLGGKVLRIDRDGNAAPGNRAPKGFDPRIFAYGFHDPVGLGFHPSTERLIVADRRSTTADEIQLAAAGTNGGWDPQCAPPRSGYCDDPATIKDAARESRTTFVAWRAGKAGDGLSGIERLRAQAWHGWRNAIAVAFNSGQRVDLIKVGAEGSLQIASLLAKLGVGFSAVAEGPDGLYAITSGRAGGEEIWRITLQ